MNLKITVGAVLFGLVFSLSAQADKILIATESGNPPFNMKNKKGDLMGFDIDIARALCDQMKAECELVEKKQEDIISGLMDKKYDAIVASLSMTDELEKQLLFSNHYYSNYLHFLSSTEAKLTLTPAGLKGKKLGTKSETVSAKYLKDNFSEGSEIMLFDSREKAFAALKSGSIDAVLVNFYPAYDWLIKPDNSGFDLVGSTIDANDKIGIAFRKENKALAGKFNEALNAIRNNGTYNGINKNYFPFSIY